MTHRTLSSIPRPWLWGGALALVFISAGAATGTVLSGNIAGLVPFTASQSLLVQNVTMNATDVQLGTVKDDRTGFTASAEMNTGDGYTVNLTLANESNQSLVGEFTLLPPSGVQVSVVGQNDAACVVQQGPFTWMFTLLPTTNNNVDLIVTVALADDAAPGFYTVDAQLKQIDRNALCFASDDVAQTPEDTPVDIDVLANDHDLCGQGLTIVSVTDPLHGSVVINPDNTLTYIPDPDYFGQDTFTYTVEDCNGNMDQATVTLTVDNVNDAPIAADDAVSTPEDTAVVIDVLANDTDVDGDALTVSLQSQPAHGTATVVAGQKVKYVPAPNYSGPDSFNYLALDGSLSSNIATVNIVVVPVNDKPVAVNDVAATPEDTPVTINILLNDTDGEGAILSVASITQPAHGAVVVNPDQSVTYTPALNFNGTDTFTYTNTDGALPSNPATVTVTVTPVNDPPVALNDSMTALEDTPVSIAVLANDLDPDGNALSVAVLNQPAHGAVTLGVNGTVHYTPSANFNGTDSFTYTNTDGSLTSNMATVTITIVSVNDVPVANNDLAGTPEDTPVVIPVLANDVDVDGDVLTVATVVQPVNGAVVINQDGTVTYSPKPNFNGTDTFTYRATDGFVLSNIATVTVIVSPVNDAPVAYNDSKNTAKNVAVTINVLANDIDVDGNALTVTNLTQPAHGTAVLNLNGTVTYTPANNYVGTDSFTYTAYDGAATSNVATVAISIGNTNTAPVAYNDTATTPEDTAIVIPVLVNDTDVDGDPLAVTSLTQPVHGTVVANQNGTVTYTPSANYNGTDVFTYRATDGTLSSNIATVTVTITPVNDPPVAYNDVATTVEDTAVVIAVLANDIDVDGDALTVTNLTQPAHGTVTVGQNGQVVYTPAPDFCGTDTFTYTAFDGTATSNVATVTVTVTPANDPPVAYDDTASTPENAYVNIAVLANDTDVDSPNLTVAALTQPAHGTATLNPDFTVKYTPDNGFHGTDTFTYKANDGMSVSNMATVTVTVTSVNHAPKANFDYKTTPEDTPVTIAILSNDTDADGDSLAVTNLTQPLHGTVALNQDGTVKYTPNANFHGTDAFTYKAFDGQLYSAQATVNVTVSSVNDAPVAYDDAVTGEKNHYIVIDVLGNDVDVDGDTLIVCNLTQPSKGVAYIYKNKIIYYPPSGWTGTVTLTYKVSDGTLISNPATVTITVED